MGDRNTDKGTNRRRGKKGDRSKGRDQADHTVLVGKAPGTAKGHRKHKTINGL